MDEKIIKNNIRQRRRTLSISQTEMAERLGIERNTYRNIERGRTRIINCRLEEIARELKITPEELLMTYPQYDPAREARLQDEAQARYDGQVEILTQAYERKLAEAGEKIGSLEKRISELEATLRDKCEIIGFLREQNRTLVKDGGN